MRMVRVKPNPAHDKTQVLCCACNKWSPDRETFADLDGEPFKAYYCEPCAELAQAKEDSK